MEPHDENGEVILPLCCFPPVQWCAIVLQNEHAVIDIHEHYVKQTFRNRFEIAGVNGRTTLTVPVVGQKGKKIPFKDIRIDEDGWRRRHFSSLRSAYRRSAFFEHYEDQVQNIFTGRQSFLLDFNIEALQFISSVIGKLNFDLSEEFVENSGRKDFRNEFEPSCIWPQLAAYPQVFGDRHGFMNNLSVLDLIFNVGPSSGDVIRN